MTTLLFPFLLLLEYSGTSGIGILKLEYVYPQYSGEKWWGYASKFLKGALQRFLTKQVINMRISKKASTTKRL